MLGKLSGVEHDMNWGLRANCYMIRSIQYITYDVITGNITQYKRNWDKTD